MVGLIQYADFSDGFLSLSNIHLSFFHIFHGLIAHFFLVFNNTILYGCIVFFYSHTKRHLRCFQILAIMNKATINNCVWFCVCVCVCVDLSFQLLRVNTKEHDGWIISYKYVQFCRKPLLCLPKQLYHFAFPPELNEFPLLHILVSI